MSTTAGATINGEESAPLIPKAKPQRRNYAEVNVLRLGASLWVVIRHFGMAFCPELIWHSNPPIFFLGNQETPLMLFYVISGFVVPQSFFRNQRVQEVCLSLVRRIPRIAMPVFCVSLLSLAFDKAGLYTQIAEAWGLADSTWCCGATGAHCCRVPNVSYAAYYSTAFIWGFKNGPFPAGVLWALPFFWAGTLFTFVSALWSTALLHIVKGSHEALSTKTYQCMLCVILHLVTLFGLWCLSVQEDHYPKAFEQAMPFPGTGGTGRNQIWQALFCFEIGVIVAHLECLMQRPKLERSSAFKVATLILFVCGLFSLEYLTMNTRHWKAGQSMWSLRHQDFACLQATFMLVFSVLFDGVCDNCCKGMMAVQKLHFSVYLIHGSVIYALGTRVYISTRGNGYSSPHGYCLTVLACLPPLYALAYVVHHYMEIPFGETFPRWVEKHLRELPAKVRKDREPEIPLSSVGK